MDDARIEEIRRCAHDVKPYRVVEDDDSGRWDAFCNICGVQLGSHLTRGKAQYLEGVTHVERLDQAVEDVLRGKRSSEEAADFYLLREVDILEEVEYERAPSPGDFFDWLFRDQKQIEGGERE